MEKEYEIQEFKHACKFCNKRFLCGRSLGGHMRSHIRNISSETEHKQKQKQKVQPINSGCIGSEASYGLRENPKKTWRRRIADSCEGDKFCKECGKCFHSWQALFGHMKCHSEKERVSNHSLEDQDSSWTITHKNIVMDDIQSDNEITAPTSRKRRSKRTSRTRYMVATSSSVSEVEQEQEEVAMSLIMLSKDLSPWSGFCSLAAESSDNNSVYFEPRSSVQTKYDPNSKNKNSSAMNVAKLMKQNDKCELRNSVSKKLNFKGKSLELLDLDTENGFKMNKCYKSGVSTKGLMKSTKKSELDYVSTTLEDSEVRVNGTESIVLSKSFHEDEFMNKRGKFECTTCNKIFHSYQALGGHRASHKKTKGCSSKIENAENGENSIEFENNLFHESKIIKGHHECPICFKIFQSGQALGGHKRSHMVASESTSRVPQIREFLDLNLAPATEEECYSHADSNRPWWIVEGNHNQEALVG